MISGRYIPDYYHLRAFLALMSERRMGLAANRLKTSQANLRRMIGHLESWSGAPLCRTNEAGEFVATAIGEVVVTGCGPLLEACRAFHQKLDRIHRRGRLLRVGVEESLFRSRLFARILVQLRSDDRFRPAPVSLPAHVGASALESGAADLFIATSQGKGRRIITRTVRKCPLVVLSAEKRVSDPGWAELSSSGWKISPAISSSTESKLTAACRAAGGSGGGRLNPAAFAAWRTRGEATGYCIMADDEADCSEFKGSIHPCPESLASEVTVTHLVNHPYPFLEEVTGKLVSTLGKLPQPIPHGP
ncbi:LysR family transcriptional regulator [Haloferula sargassicola]|uniref:HTH lysR-type domain-containing protein n=1 Tax=Haloferula sargassicola TaxID=490096 RepID=A0ABP9UN48_9BACT